MSWALPHPIPPQNIQSSVKVLLRSVLRIHQRSPARWTVGTIQANRPPCTRACRTMATCHSTRPPSLLQEPRASPALIAEAASAGAVSSAACHTLDTPNPRQAGGQPEGRLKAAGPPPRCKATKSRPDRAGEGVRAAEGQWGGGVSGCGPTVHSSRARRLCILSVKCLCWILLERPQAIGLASLCCPTHVPFSSLSLSRG